MRKLLPILLLLAAFSAVAQPEFKRTDTIPVFEGSDTLAMPWAGGMNAVQFSNIDLDMDGALDLFVFDRSGNRIIPLIHRGGTDYEYAPELRKKFPELEHFALLEDYNLDSLPDIFSYGTHPTFGTGIKAHRNTTDTALSFVVAKPIVQSSFGGGPAANIFIQNTDIPGLADMDNDSDMDIVLFGFGLWSQYVEFNQNVSIDTFAHADSLQYRVRSQCWGAFHENFTGCGVTLYDTCFGNWMLKSGDHAMHGISALLPIDLDGDGDKDLLIGDDQCTRMVGLYNDGTVDSHSVLTVDTLFPSYDVPINISEFPAAFYVDVDNDGVKELIVSVNADKYESKESVHLYENAGTTASPDFRFTNSRAFIQSRMIDVGRGARPVVFDENADGLMDIVVANNSYYHPSLVDTSMLAVYRNVGNDSVPKFTLLTTDYDNMSGFGLTGVHPAFGDIDGDGDIDMIFGDGDGELHLMDNIAGVSNPCDFSLVADANIDSIDVGQFATPQLVDIDRDGDLDLIIGERNGNLNYYENQGSSSSHDFQLVSDTFGGIDVRAPLTPTGYSVPFAHDDSGIFLLYVGSEQGNLYVYDGIDGNLTGTFTEQESMLFGYREGGRSAPCIAEFTNNITPELLLGNISGGLAWFTADVQLPVGISEIGAPELVLSIRPNPTKGLIDIRATNATRHAPVELYDLLGRKLISTRLRGRSLRLDLSGYERGIYLVKVGTAQRYAVQRVALF